MYLRITAGTVHLLVPVDQIREVFLTTLGENCASAGGRFVEWRGQTLPSIDLAEWLGLGSCPSTTAIVLHSPADAATACLMRVSAAARVVRLDDHEFHPLPSLPEQLESIIDAVWRCPEQDGQPRLCYLRMRPDHDLLAQPSGLPGRIGPLVTESVA